MESASGFGVACVSGIDETPFMKPLANDDRNSLQRLVKVAKSKTPQSRPVANFLLAWWDAKKYGGFDFVDLWDLDKDLVDDIINVLRIISIERSYPSALGHEEDFLVIIQHCRMNLAADGEQANAVRQIICIILSAADSGVMGLRRFRQ
jgi:hypothetical protein